MNNTSTAPRTPEVALPSRREFLYYLGGMSAALFSAGACGLLYQYVTRSVPLEQQDGVYEVTTAMPFSAFEPVAIREAKTWLILRDDGLLALSRICPYEPGIFQEVKIGVNDRYECPSCGSKFRLDGTLISGPAPRGLDHYGLWIRTPEGRLNASEGEPILVVDAVQVFIDTRVRIPGQPRRDR